jgi:AcrR family transcriptional regulator
VLFRLRENSTIVLYSARVAMTPIKTKGERTRATILDEAARLATIVGLDGLTIGGLASAIGMSKSGLYAHFGSKQELQLATIDAARETFVDEVLRPALSAPKGIQRLFAICETYLSHIERRVFPGGCFFSAAAADVGSWPGPARDSIVAQRQDWLQILERLAREAQQLDELDRSLAPAQLAFELQALLAAANTTFILNGDAEVFERARRAVRERLHTN